MKREGHKKCRTELLVEFAGVYQAGCKKNNNNKKKISRLAGGESYSKGLKRFNPHVFKLYGISYELCKL